MRQPVDRDHKNVVLDPLDPLHANNAHDTQRAVAGLPSPVS
jgi:hypothetical protein